MNSFNKYNLPPILLKNLANMNYNVPTVIQDQVIPIALTGQDVLGSSETGSGKTVAFSVPVLSQIINQAKSEKALVLAPTRELAGQIIKVISTMISGYRDLRAVLLIGGESINRQFMQLRNNYSIIVGTPGRVEDHLRRGSLIVKNVKFLVLDEIDQMLSMGLAESIEEIVKHLPKERQTLMFSATLDKTVEKLAQVYSRNPARVEISSSNKKENIDEKFIQVSEAEKFALLIKELDQRKGSVIVFVKTQKKTEYINQRLNEANYKSRAIHGGMIQNKRRWVMEDFRNKRFRFLIATDVAARGLDISCVEHVINYDLPMTPEEYTHRIGRTGRGIGTTGHSLSMVSSLQDQRLWKHIINNSASTKENFFNYPKFDRRRKNPRVDIKRKDRNTFYPSSMFYPKRKKFTNDE